ncbi:ubiquitin conjugating enzyme E2 [Culex quinquefasciatus]|uniref:Ubiquitin conjugating enzyme E2 n=1 Tax=Culex quinquefasciatus TaxID=7176 RepID=B0WRV2_CULQU|nr:ubiquitin conjugating enzyme E2 [Culex quinquefasciatus]|eukprot:XP_001851436.1 ubiquitin conjugating enzyme E2 [Culex quinquefasciatus]
MLNRFRMRKEKPSKSESISGASDTNAAIIQDAATTEHRKLILDAGRWEAKLMSLIKEPPPGVTVDEESVSQNLTQWIINIDGVEGTLYEGEHFQLLFKFNNKYPFDSTEVTFIGSNIPVHRTFTQRSPALSVQSVCLSISSMLSSCREKRRPPDNGIYVKTCNKNPKKTKWWYHDDSV